MKNIRLRLMHGEGVMARAMRGSVLTLLNVGGSNFLRLASNLVLTRLLFPEAFGLMAIVQIFLGGLQMFSDVGIRTSILQNPRGDDADFLNTAWTLQIIRGFLLWLGACALAIPAAQLYNEPMLAQMLPVVGLNAVVIGFTTTKILVEQRHLRLGRQTLLGLGWQVFGILITVLLAYWLRSVWALVLGGLISTFVQTILMHVMMPGIANRLCWNREIVRDIFGFGKFIFFSTVAGFIIQQGDKAVLARFVSMTDLGLYNIGFFLGAFPLLIARALSSKVIFPLYRLRPPAESVANRKNILRARRLVVLSGLLLSFPFSFGGPFLIEILYDPRYVASGAIVTLAASMSVPLIVFLSYGGALLANGDSRRHFIMLTTTALAQLGFLFVGVPQFGALGAVAAPALATLLIYPMRFLFTHRYQAHDPLGDVILLTAGLGINGLACYLHSDIILAWLI